MRLSVSNIELYIYVNYSDYPLYADKTLTYKYKYKCFSR